MNYKEHCLKIAREHIENWAKDETVPLFHSVSQLVLSCLVVILIGEDFYRRHGKEVVPMMANFERDLQNPLLRVVPGSLWWITGPGRRLNETCTRFDKLVSAELHDILENPDKHKGRTDYFYYVVSQVGDKYAFCYGRHIVGLVFGGHANAAMTMPWLFLHAHRIPGALDRIREELDLDPTARRPYLDACLRETSRLYTNTSMMRMTTTSVEIAGHTVPGKTLVACSPLATQRLNKSEGGIFVDSNRWDPTRFLEDPDAYSNWFQRAEFVQFGMGIHSCPGEKFARILIFDTVLKSLLERYDVDVISGLEEGKKGIDGVGVEASWTEENFGTPYVRGEDVIISVKKRS